MEEKKVVVPEVPETAIELADNQTGMVTGSMKEDLDSLMFIADNIDKAIVAKDKIRMALLKLAKPGDWTTFKSQSNPEGTAELGYAGAFRISSTVGINFANWVANKVTGNDKQGDFYRWEVTVTCSQGKRSVVTFGRAGTRDKFFGKAYGEMKDLSDIPEGDLKIAAIRGAMKEGVKILLGLHHQDPAELRKLGVPLGDKGHKFDTGHTAKGGVISEPQRKRMFAMWKEAEMQDEVVRMYLGEKYPYTDGHTKQLKKSDYEAVCAWISKGGDKA